MTLNSDVDLEEAPRIRSQQHFILASSNLKNVDWLVGRMPAHDTTLSHLRNNRLGSEHGLMRG